MASESSRISIGLPVYNGERYIREALDSILAQTFTDFELIISDNASTDDTEAICRAYAERDPRIRYHRNEANVGATKNFNLAFEMSSGEFFKWAAHDDVLAPDYLEICIRAFERAPSSVVFCFPRMTVIDSEGRVVKRCDYLSKRRLSGDLEGIHELEFSDVVAVTSGRITEIIWGLMRADALRKTRLLGAYDAADLVLVAELSLIGTFWQLPDYPFFMRLHGQHDQRKARSAEHEALWWDTSSDSRFIGPTPIKVFFEDLRAISRSDQSLLDKARRCIEMRAFFSDRLRKRYRYSTAMAKSGLTNTALASSRYTYGPLRLWALTRFLKLTHGSKLRAGVRFVWSIPGDELRESMARLKSVSNERASLGEAVEDRFEGAVAEEAAGKKLRITFVLRKDIFGSGGVRVISIYADRLKRRGHEVFVVSAAKKEQDDPSYFDACGIPCRILESDRPVTEFDVPDADVVVATWWETAPWVEAFPPRKGAKAYFVQDYGAHAGQPLDKVSKTWLAPFHKITISKFLLGLIETHSGDANPTYAPNGVDLEMFEVPPRGKQKRPTVGLMYSTRSQKGLDLMLAAIDRAKAWLPDLHVVAYGPGEIDAAFPLPEGSRYERSVADDELKNVYGQCDAWLFASTLEGFGLPILESMACRTPVIATTAGAAPELLATGGGALVQTRDPEEMAEAIRTVCTLSEREWCAMSDAAYETATRHSWDYATDLFEFGLYAAIERTRLRELSVA